jgi:hypothetical protein
MISSKQTVFIDKLPFIDESLCNFEVNSPRAIKVNITIMRVFVRLRQMMTTQRVLAGKLAELEERIQDHDEQITDIFKAIRQLMAPPTKPKRKIGFNLKEKQAGYGKKKG